MNIAKQLLRQPIKLAFLQNNVRFLSAAKSYKYITVEQKGTDNRVGLITMNRPEVLNALCIGMIDEIVDALGAFDKDDDVAATVITGVEKAFSAGADIKEASTQVPEVQIDKFNNSFVKIGKARKPLIAAVNGIAFGGGAEMSLLCDVIYAGENAKFGLPEVKIGIIPGAGGTQRLAKTIGKSRAMEMCLTGDVITAEEALRVGLVSKVFPVSEVIEEALKLGDKIGELSPKAVEMCKASVNNSYETHLQDGLKGENQFFKNIFKD